MQNLKSTVSGYLSNPRYYIFIIIISVLLCVICISNVVAYANIINLDIAFSRFWAITLLALNLFLALLGLVSLFIVIYKISQGKLFVAGGATPPVPGVEPDPVQAPLNMPKDLFAHLSVYDINELRARYPGPAAQYEANYGAESLNCSDGNNRLACPRLGFRGTENDERINNIARLNGLAI